VIAINVLLELDAAARQHAQAANGLLRQSYPGGFAFDASHEPHLTLLQRYIRLDDLLAVTTAVESIVKSEHVSDLLMKAIGCESARSGSGDLGILQLIVERSAQLGRLQQRIADAVQPLAIDGGTPDAFVHNDDGSSVGPAIVAYVETFLPESSGERYQPHVTLGIAHRDFVRDMAAKPFAPFPFRPRCAAIYQIGDFGTARKSLWRATWGLP